VERERLLELLKAIREQGYALVDQEVGLRLLAVPVLARDGRVGGALNVGMHGYECLPKRCCRLCSRWPRLVAHTS